MAILKQISYARDNLKDLADDVEFRKKRIRIQRHGRVAFGMVSAEDVDLLENFKKVLAVSLTKKALNSGKFVSIEDIDKKISGGN